MSKFRVGEKIVVTNGCHTGAKGVVISKQHVPINNFGVPALDGHYNPMDSESVPVIVEITQNEVDAEYRVLRTKLVKIMDVYNRRHIKKVIE